VRLDFPCSAHHFFPDLMIAKVSIALFPRFAQHLMHTPCSIVEIPSGQIRDSKWKVVKNQHIHPTESNFVHRFPRYSSTIIYRCIALLQLLYRWQHQSLKFWIPVHPRTL
jgi:hypothetical protein